MAIFEIAGERIRRQSLHFDRVKVMQLLGPAPANHVETVQRIYAAIGRGDVQGVLAELDDDVSWGIESVAAGEVPAHGVLHGKANVPKFFAAWAETVDFNVFEAGDFIAAGDHVVNRLSYEATVKATGKRVLNPSCQQHWTFRNGKVIRWRGYEDTAATRDAFR